MIQIIKDCSNKPLESLCYNKLFSAGISHDTTWHQRQKESCPCVFEFQFFSFKNALNFYAFPRKTKKQKGNVCD